MNILLIEDDRSTMKAVKFALNQKGHKVVLASNEANAFNQLKENEIDLIVSDVNLPASSPITDLVWKLKSEYDHLPIVLISSVLDNPLIDESLIQGADAFIPKPIDFDLLASVVDRLNPQGCEINDQAQPHKHRFAGCVQAQASQIQLAHTGRCPKRM